MDKKRFETIAATIIEEYILEPGDRPDIEAFVALARKGLEVREELYVPSEPTHDMLKALAGDPAILAASDEEELRKRYAVMVSRISNREEKS